MLKANCKQLQRNSENHTIKYPQKSIKIKMSTWKKIMQGFSGSIFLLFIIISVIQFEKTPPNDK